jgi:pimeloyl-ACP methyl ester carboxylesterase
VTVLDELGVDRAILAGASMGAHTAVRLALSSPERVAALCLITPAYDPLEPPTGRSLAAWDALARGLRQGGVQGFLDAYDFSTVPERWRATVERVVSQRLARHEHPAAVADALEAVPRSQPFERLEQLGLIEMPTVVVGSRDEADPAHPLALAETYARTIPSARLLVELPGQSPLAWQGAQLSRVIVDLISTG